MSVECKEICIADRYNSLTIRIQPGFEHIERYGETHGLLHVEAKAGPFCGSFSPWCFYDDLYSLYKQFMKLHESFQVESGFQFESLEHDVRLDIYINKYGHLYIHVILEPMSGGGCPDAILEYDISIDQSYLPSILSDMKRLLEKD